MGVPSLTTGKDPTFALIIRDLGARPIIRTIAVKGATDQPRLVARWEPYPLSASDPVSETSVFWEARRDGSDLHRLPLVPRPRSSLERWLLDGGWALLYL